MPRLNPSALLGVGPLGCVLLAWIGAGCGGATSPWKNQSVYSRPPVLLYREYQEADGKRSPLGYDHPIEMSFEQVASLLGHLKYDKNYGLRKEKIRRVFSTANVASLAEPLMRALKKLTPDERLRFVLTKNTGSAFTTSLKGSSGVIFKSSSDRVSIAFDAINASLPTPKRGTSVNMEFPEDPTQIIDVSPLQLFPGATHHSDSPSSATHPRWLEVEMDHVPTFVDPQPQTKQSPDKSSAPPAKGLDNIRGRLQKLKRLLEDGTLTQGQYDKAVQGALGEL